MTTGRRWLEWRYAAGGLGWGVAVGAATGLLLGLAAGVSLLWEGDGAGRLLERTGLLLGVPVWGLLLGAFLGGVAGTPGGLLNAVVQPHVRGDRTAWWSSWAIATVTAAAVVGLVGGWQAARAVVDADAGRVVRNLAWAAAVGLVPALVGGWLTARTGRGLRERARDVLRGPTARGRHAGEGQARADGASSLRP